MVTHPPSDGRAKAFVARHQWLVTREDRTCFEPDQSSTWQVSDFIKFVGEHKWIFARTMPENPHEYTLRRDTSGITFDEAVRFIRQHGSIEFFKGRAYKMLAVEDHKYWTMGSPLGSTSLINRKGWLATTGNPVGEPPPSELPLLAPQEEHLPRENCNEDSGEFEWFASYVVSKGSRRPRSRTSYLDFNGYRYWQVGVPNKTQRINRARLPVPQT